MLVSSPATLPFIPWRQALSLSLELTVFLARLAGQLVRVTLLSSSSHQTLHWDYSHTSHTQHFTWVLGIQIQVLTLTQKMCFPTKQSP